MTTMMMDRWGTWWCCHFSCNNMSHCCFVFLQILMTFARQKWLFFFSSSSTANWLCWCLWRKSTNFIMCNCWLSCLSVSFFATVSVAFFCLTWRIFLLILCHCADVVVRTSCCCCCWLMLFEIFCQDAKHQLSLAFTNLLMKSHSFFLNVKICSSLALQSCLSCCVLTLHLRRRINC